MTKKFLVMWGALIASAALVLGGAPASATEQYETCTPAAAYTEIVTPEVPATPGTPAVEAVYETVVVEAAGWQRYSWTGGPWESETPPAFPSDNWQPNVAGDPHGIGVQGAYFVSNGNSGNGDWFYLEATPEVTEQVLVSPYVPAVPGTPAIPAVTIDHPAVVCDDEPEEPVAVTPLPPTFDDLCGTDNDVTRIPDDTDEYTYTGLVTNTDGVISASVTATAAEGYTFGSGTTLTWNYTFDNTPCPVDTPPVVQPPAAPQPPVAAPVVPVANKLATLPETGAEDVIVSILGALTALGIIAGGTALLLWNRKRLTSNG